MALAGSTDWATWHTAEPAPTDWARTAPLAHRVEQLTGEVRDLTADMARMTGTLASDARYGRAMLAKVGA